MFTLHCVLEITAQKYVHVCLYMVCAHMFVRLSLYRVCSLLCMCECVCVCVFARICLCERDYPAGTRLIGFGVKFGIVS